jgi:hypothetical protein
MDDTAAPTSHIALPARVVCDRALFLDSGRYEVELVFGDQHFAPDIGYDLATWLVDLFARKHASQPLRATLVAVWQVKRGAVAILLKLMTTQGHDASYDVKYVVELLRGATTPVHLPAPTHVIVSARTTAEHDAKVAAAAALAEPDFAALAPGGWVQRPLGAHNRCPMFHGGSSQAEDQQLSSAFVVRLASFKPLPSSVLDVAVTWINASFTLLARARRVEGVWKCVGVRDHPASRLASVLARFDATPVPETHSCRYLPPDSMYRLLIHSTFVRFSAAALAQALMTVDFPAELRELLYTGTNAVDDAYLDRLWPCAP